MKGCDMQEDISKYENILEELPAYERIVSKDDYLDECRKRADSSCSSFVYDSYGFTARIDSEKDNLLFFSVPYDEGFTAKVNGKETEIVKADAGFCAVPIKKGENIIEFEYETPGLKTGAVISLIGAVLLIGYLLSDRIIRKKRNK